MVKAKETISAADGHSYRLEIARIGALVVGRLLLPSGVSVGKATLLIEGSTAKLADIVIAKSVPSGNPLAQWLALSWFNRNYRGRGLGSVLLRAVAEYLASIEVRKIHGTMVGDLPRLIRWYRREGFVVDESSHAISKELG